MSKIRYVEIELAIAKSFGIRSHIIVPNCYVEFGGERPHECDLLVITKSGYAIEVEIKMSKSDMIADFRKKHGHNNDKLNELYYAFPSEIYHECESLVPADCGIFVINLYGDTCIAQCKRNAKPKHRNKLSTEQQLHFARLGAMRIWNAKQKEVKQ